MSDEPQLDEQLARHFGTQRADDTRRVPAFASMLAAAEREAADARSVVVDAPIACDRAHRWRTRLLAVALPTLAAAGLVLMLRPTDSGADLEFEALVSDWSRTSAQTRASPTDALLSLPGDQYLRGMPTLGGDRLPSRTRTSP